MHGQRIWYSQQTLSLLIARLSTGNTLSIAASSVVCVRKCHIYIDNQVLIRSSSQLYSSGSSLTTRRKHLGKHHLEEYLTLIANRNLVNKLPDALLRERDKQRARDFQWTPFSIQAFEQQLMTVIVSNDLVSSTLLVSAMTVNTFSVYSFD